jgi:hypothetical protein
MFRTLAEILLARPQPSPFASAIETASADRRKSYVWTPAVDRGAVATNPALVTSWT